jgi:phage terminase large subunit-like protein
MSHPAPDFEQVVETGWQYAEDVIDGKIPAAQPLIHACQRAFDMLEELPDDIYYDYEAAQRVIDFFGYLRHLKGPLANTPLYLAPWQIFIIAQLYGWKAKDGRRLFRTAYIEVPRKSGKSTFCSGLALYHEIADGEEGAEVYSAATTKDQARIVFGDAQAMARKSPHLSRHLKVYQNSIVHLDTGSVFKPLSSDANTLEGLNPSASVIDELHVHKTPEVWDVMNVAAGARAQPLLFGITTAGTNMYGVCYEQRDYVKKIMGGHVVDYTYFGCIWTIDEGDDWRDPTVWQKANPGYGISVYPDDLERLCKQAQESSTGEVNFRTKRLNEWMNSSAAWIKASDFEACMELPKPPLDYWKNKKGYIGLDLAQVSDIAAMVALFEEDGKVYPYGRYYLPEDTVYNATGQLGLLYRQWVRDGWIITTPGNVTDLAFIENDIRDLCDQHEILEIAHDPHGAQLLTANLLADDLPMVKQGQSLMALTDQSKEFEKAVLSKTLCPGDDPVLSWSVSNAVVYIDPNDNIKVKKENEKNKIDPVIATIMALGRLKVNGGLIAPSPYESRGLRTL